MRLRVGVLLLSAVLLTGCAPVALSAKSPPASPASTPTPTPTPTVDPIAGLTMDQRVGQLFMVGTWATSANPVTLSAVADRHVGSIFLHGRAAAGVTATKTVVTQFTSLVPDATTGGVPLWVTTDQEPQARRTSTNGTAAAATE